jgi:pimeloyl-ACP methyl ester carboxylesterase
LTPLDPATLYKSPAGYAAMMAWYDAAIRRLPVPCESLVVPTRHGDTHIVAAGPPNAPAVVLLHALSANAALWARQLPALTQSYRVYAPDIIGMSGKSAPTRLPYGGPAYALWLRDVLDGLGVERAHLIGLGFSGWLIVKFAGVAPERITRAALLSPAGFLPVRWRYLIPIIWDVLFISDAQARRLAHTLLAPLSVPLDEEVKEALYLTIKHFKNQFEAPSLPEHELRQLTAPALVLLGEHEAVWDPQVLAARARHTLPNLRAAEIIGGAGRGLTASHSEIVTARLLKFLAETI